MRITFLLVLLLIGAGAAAPASAGPTIEWKLLDRFRLFDAAGPADREKVEALLDQLADPNAAPSELMPHYRTMLGLLGGKEAAALRTSHWQQAERRYAPEYLRPRPYRVEAKLTGAPAGALCRWSVVSAAAISDDPARPLSAPRACEEPVILRVDPEFFDRQEDGLSQFGASGVIVVSYLAAAAPIRAKMDFRDVVVVALGDSFISGEGNPDVPVRFPAFEPDAMFRLAQWPDKVHKLGKRIERAQWWDEPCHRSLLSWPVLASLRLAARNRHAAVSLVHLGCSGAEIDDGLLKPQIGGLPGCPDNRRKEAANNCPRNPGRFEPLWGADRPYYQDTRSQIETLEALLRASGRKADRVFLSIGGNDIGFVGVIKYLALPPNGYFGGPLVPGFLFDLGKAGIVCPREGPRSEATVLRRFCKKGNSVEARMELLREKFDRLGRTFVRLNIPPRSIYQTAYPNILEDVPPDPGKPDAAFCHHALRKRDIDSLARAGSERWQKENDYFGLHGDRIYPHGFEAMQGVVKSFLRWRQRWSFQLAHPAGTQCEDRTSPKASEMCKADWAWRSLNGFLLTGVENSWNDGRVADFAVNRRTSIEGVFGWHLVTGHVAESRGHGWCRAGADDPLELPFSQYDRSSGTRKWEDRRPDQFEPYLEERQRWFRTTNDSALTQYAGPERFHHGTIHPTYRAHVAVADAVLGAMRQDADRADR